MSDEKLGFLVVLDGCEGAGKSTQIALLKKRYEKYGYSVVTTREPGGSPEAEKVRELLVTGDAGRWDGVSELLLFAAARRNHVETLIKPALAQGKIVLCDRFVPSTIAYQGFGRGLDLDLIKQITKCAIGDFEPDLTLLFFIDPELGLKRAMARRGKELRFESLEREFHERVHEGYRHVLHTGNRVISPDGMRYVEITVTDDPDIDTTIMIETVTDQLDFLIQTRMRREQPTLITVESN